MRSYIKTSCASSLLCHFFGVILVWAQLGLRAPRGCRDSCESGSIAPPLLRKPEVFHVQQFHGRLTNPTKVAVLPTRLCDTRCFSGGRPARNPWERVAPAAPRRGLHQRGNAVATRCQKARVVDDLLMLRVSAHQASSRSTAMESCRATHGSGLVNQGCRWRTQRALKWEAVSVHEAQKRDGCADAVKILSPA